MIRLVVFAVFLTGYLATGQTFTEKATKDVRDLSVRNLRLRIILDSIRAHVDQQTNPSSEQFERILDEQVRQANQTAEQLTGMYSTELEGASGITHDEATNLIVDTYSKSLRRFLGQVSRTTTEKPETIAGDIIVKSLRDYWKTEDERKMEIPEGNDKKIRQISDKLGASCRVPQQYSPKVIKEMLKLMNEFKMLEVTESSSETSVDHPTSLKINKNTTIKELLTNVGEDCLSVMLCITGADPGSMGSFGPWAVERFDGNQQRVVAYIYPDLTLAYQEGQKQTEDFFKYCAKRFNKCPLKL